MSAAKRTVLERLVMCGERGFRQKWPVLFAKRHSGEDPNCNCAKSASLANSPGAASLLPAQLRRSGRACPVSAPDAPSTFRSPDERKRQHGCLLPLDRGRTGDVASSHGEIGWPLHQAIVSYQNAIKPMIGPLPAQAAVPPKPAGRDLPGGCGDCRSLPASSASPGSLCQKAPRYLPPAGAASLPG